MTNSLKILPLKEGKREKKVWHSGKGGGKILEREGASGSKVERTKVMGREGEGGTELGDD